MKVSMRKVQGSLSYQDYRGCTVQTIVYTSIYIYIHVYTRSIYKYIDQWSPELYTYTALQGKGVLYTFSVFRIECKADIGDIGGIADMYRG